jgi:hypothetical protein
MFCNGSIRVIPISVRKAVSRIVPNNRAPAIRTLHFQLNDELSELSFLQHEPDTVSNSIGF